MVLYGTSLHNRVDSKMAIAHKKALLRGVEGALDYPMGADERPRASVGNATFKETLVLGRLRSLTLV
jgi:hypothetical protein